MNPLDSAILNDFKEYFKYVFSNDYLEGDLTEFLNCVTTYF